MYVQIFKTGIYLLYSWSSGAIWVVKVYILAIKVQFWFMSLHVHSLVFGV